MNDFDSIRQDPDVIHRIVEFVRSDGFLPAIGSVKLILRQADAIDKLQRNRLAE